MLEYMYFEFAPLLSERNTLRVSSLEDLLITLDELNAADGLSLQDKIVNDVTSGLQYLHGHGCFHRDLKTANVLVSNQHYCSLTSEEIDEAFKKEPVVCKLTDFGESRTEQIQTAVIKSTCATNRVGRGTPSYMAPEILTSARLEKVRSVDLKCIDIWALGMVMYSALNPDITFPYKLDLQQARAVSSGHFSAIDHIIRLHGQEQHIKPTMSPKYHHQQKTKWSHLIKAYDECTSIIPTQRATLDCILQLTTDKDAQYHEVIPLPVHQGSAIEEVDKRIAGCGLTIEESVRNDGTNSCALLCAVIGDRLTNQTAIPWQDVAAFAEDVITNHPSSFNHLRNKTRLYDSQETSSILWEGGVLIDRYEMSEEIISTYGIFTTEGKYK